MYAIYLYTCNCSRKDGEENRSTDHVADEVCWLDRSEVLQFDKWRKLSCWMEVQELDPRTWATKFKGKRWLPGWESTASIFTTIHQSRIIYFFIYIWLNIYIYLFGDVILENSLKGNILSQICPWVQGDPGWWNFIVYRIHTYIHTYIHSYIHSYVHSYVQTYIHTHTHTYTHTHYH